MSSGCEAAGLDGTQVLSTPEIRGSNAVQIPLGISKTFVVNHHFYAHLFNEWLGQNIAPRAKNPFIKQN